MKQQTDNEKYFVNKGLQHAKELLYLVTLPACSMNARDTIQTADQNVHPCTVHIYCMDSATELALQF
jgi:hypothetical protein